jgi:hypothetical protein
MPRNLAQFPPSTTVEQAYKYLAEHIAEGREGYTLEIREHYLAIPPRGDTHDDSEQKVFMRGVY